MRPTSTSVAASLVALALLLGGCDEESPAGTWTGSLDETRNLTLVLHQPGGGATGQPLGGGEHDVATEIELRETGERRYALSLRGCELALRERDGALEVEPDRGCDQTFGGWTGRFTFRGTGSLRGGQLRLELIGNAADEGGSGALAWTFVGERAP